MDQWDSPQEPKYLGLTAAQFNLAFLAIVGAVGLGIAAYLGAFGALLGSSGGDGSSSGTTAVQETTPTPAADGPKEGVTAQAAADAAVLKLDDMPSGWTKDVPDDDDDLDFEFSEECAILNEDEIHFPGEIAYATSEEFEGPDGQSANSDASVFSSETAAQEAVDLFDSTFSRCSDELVAALESLFLEGEETGGYDATLSNISMQELAFPELGDSTSALRLAVSMTVEGVPLEMTVDFVIIRTGRIVGGFTYVTFFAVNSFEEEVMAKTAAEKLAAANGSLAE